MITRVNALRGRCRDGTNPEACLRKLQTEIDAAREKQKKARTDIANIRRAAAEHRRNQTQAQRAQGAEAPR